MTEEEYGKRNKLERELILADYMEVLSTEAGKRMIGGIFHVCGLNASGISREPLEMTYQMGLRDAGLAVANTLRELHPRLVGECEAAYRDFIRRLDESETTTI